MNGGTNDGDQNVYKLSFFCSRGSEQGSMKLERAKTTEQGHID